MDVPFVVSMLTFILTVFLVFKQPTVRIPFTSKYFKIDYGVAPLIGVIILLATFTISTNTITTGIVGTSNVRPWAIIIFVMSLSYVCVSLDYTGFFEYVALKVAGASKGSGARLFIYFFLLTAVLTLFTDNDIVILTMTLITFYVAKNAKIDPIPLLFSQFFAVNIMGMALYIGNPTNIVAADAYGLSFIEFAKWMLLPSFFSSIACLAIMWLLFRRSVPKEFKTPKLAPELAIKNYSGAMFGFAILCLTIVFMSIPTEIIRIPLWAIPLSFAIVMFLYDLAVYRSKVLTIVSRVPWKIVPFLVGLFIIVEGLATTGWTELLGSQLAKLSGSTALMVIGVCVLSSLAASVMNNHLMSIFFVRAFEGASFAALPQVARLGSTLALIAGSNFGANLTLIGALAGIMWAKILSDKGCNISFSQFTKYGLIIMPIIILVTSLTILIELAIFG